MFFNSIGNFCEKNGVLKNSACVFGLFAKTGSAFGENLLLQTNCLFCFTFLILFEVEGAPCTSS